MGTFAWDLSLRNVRLGSSALKLSIGDSCSGSFAWELSLDLELALGNFGLETLAWAFLFWGTFDWELPLRINRLGTFA